MRNKLQMIRLESKAPHEKSYYAYYEILNTSRRLYKVVTTLRLVIRK